MSLVIGKERAVSHSCLVASAIDMPEELEEQIENLDEIFQRQMNTVIAAKASILKALEHPLLKDWPQVEALAKVCHDRARYIMMNDYIRALSYGAMRMINARLTDVLNAIMPVKNFIDEALAKIKEEEKQQAEKEEAEKKALEEQIAAAPAEVVVQINNPVPTSENVMDTPEPSDDDKTPTVDKTGQLVFQF